MSVSFRFLFTRELRVSFNSCNWNGGQVGALSAIENRYFCLQGSGTTSPEKGGGKILT